jgi:hypothetical protein
MFRTYLAAIATAAGLALLAAAMPASLTDAKELKGTQKKQGSTPAVRLYKFSPTRFKKTKPVGSETIRLRGSTTGNKSKGGADLDLHVHRFQPTKPGASETIKLRGSGTGNKSKGPAPAWSGRLDGFLEQYPL